VAEGRRKVKKDWVLRFLFSLEGESPHTPTPQASEPPRRPQHARREGAKGVSGARRAKVKRGKGGEKQLEGESSGEELRGGQNEAAKCWLLFSEKKRRNSSNTTKERKDKNVPMKKVKGKDRMT